MNEQATEKGAPATDPADGLSVGQAVYDYLRGFTGRKVPLPSAALIAACIARQRPTQQTSADLDPAYKDVEVCACSTPGWTHHTGFHMFVADREQRAAKAALAAQQTSAERATPGRLMDHTLADLLDSARQLVGELEAGCPCPDEPHQNGLHDLATDVVRVLGDSIHAQTSAERVIEAVETLCESLSPWQAVSAQTIRAALAAAREEATDA